MVMNLYALCSMLHAFCCLIGNGCDAPPQIVKPVQTRCNNQKMRHAFPRAEKCAYKHSIR
jgi:hypothetical protein